MMPNKKTWCITLIVVLLILVLVLGSSCSEDRKKYCIPPKAITGVCHVSCGSPAECHNTFTGDKGPGCKFGQVCDNSCGCVWADEDLDSYPSQNLGKMHYLIDCDDTDPTIFPNAPELCDNKDNDCDSDVDEGEVCKKNVYFCSTSDFSSTCSGKTWCSATTSNTSASCSFTTLIADLGSKDAYTFVCDDYLDDGDYGCFKFIKGSFTVISPCNNDNIKDEMEECDGTDISGKNCLSFGYIGGTLKCDHCSYDFNSCTGVVCNHNSIKESGEECDSTDLNGKTCQAFGLFGTGLSCTDACLFDTSGCTASRCGNGVIDSGEECDTTDLAAKTCNDYGYVGGTLLCGEDCSYDYSSCLSVVCDNNGVAGLGESCDGDDLDGRSCNDFGFAGGTLRCADDCDFEFSDCTGYACNNDGVAGPGEACDGDDLTSKDCRFFDMFKGGLLKCDDSCMFDRSECNLVCDNDNVADTGEECDGVDLRDKSCGDFGRHGGSIACSPSCNFDLTDCGPSCLEDWECTPWSYCSSMNENTTRVCTDQEECGTAFSKPLETKPCDPSVCVDDDNDGYCSCFGDALNCDCDDDDPLINPGVSELCDGNDDNCDGSVDESCPCDSGDNKTCGVNLGICREGLQNCVNDYWSLCGGLNYVGPQEEVCDNGIDEDCDGYPDDTCACTGNSSQECGYDVGECKKGTQMCFNGNWSACSGSKDPSTEFCTGKKDEDCDGKVDCDDDSCKTSASCSGTPGSTSNCFDNKKNQGELGIDCGGPCPACENVCGFGSITQSCLCEDSLRTSGYCCDGSYQLDSCSESCNDADADSLCDADEIRQGTDPNNPDTDGDGINDNEDSTPLCNQDGECDSSREYPENSENCPDDCESEGKGLSSLWWIIIILLVLVFGSLLVYLLVKKGVIKIGKKKKQESGIILSKPLFMPAVQPIATQKKLRNVSKLTDYFGKYLKMGIPKAKLREAALKEGWTDEEVNRAFEPFEKPKKQADKKFFSLFKK